MIVLSAFSEQNVEEAVPNCLIDTLLLVPILGQISSINIRFALGLQNPSLKVG